MYQVVLVDDEVLIREAVSQKILWNELGYELAASLENGEQAKEYIEGNEVDLVLTDICMPYMDGLKLSEWLHYEYPNIQIIILSGYDDFEYAKKALKFSVSDYLLKPITAVELSEVLIRMKEKLDTFHEKKEAIDKISTTYHKNRLLIQSNTFMDLLLGNKTEAENENELKEIGITLDAAAYRVAVIVIDLLSSGREIEEKVKREGALMAFVVYNVSNEIVKKHKAGEVCQGTDYRTNILFMTNKPKEFEQGSYAIACEIKEQLAKIMNFGITISFGEYAYAIKDIHNSYQEAQKALEYQYILGDNQIIDKKKVEGGIRPWYGAYGDIKNLVLCIKKNDTEQMQSYLADISEHMIGAVLPKNRACLFLQRIVEEISEVLETFDMKDSDVYEKQEEVVTKVYEALDFEEAMQGIKAYCIKTADAIDGQKNTGGKKYALLAMDYIEKNYADSEMNLNSVCSYLNISTSRFSSIFKSATGNTFMDVLIRLRMQKAKELLSNTDLKNYEIAEKVGFSDPHYFSVAFKKITGQSPSEYAKERGK